MSRGHWEINNQRVSDAEAWHGANPQAVWVQDHIILPAPTPQPKSDPKQPEKRP
jgi:hypothetical protein